MIPNEFMPHAATRPMANGSPFSMKASAKQVHLSAAAYRHLGKPEEIAMYSSETDEGIKILLIDAGKVPDFDKPTLGVSPKVDADTIRFTRFPFDIRMMMGRDRHDAIEANEHGALIFFIPKPKEQGNGST